MGIRTYAGTLINGAGRRAPGLTISSENLFFKTDVLRRRVSLRPYYSHERSYGFVEFLNNIFPFLQFFNFPNFIFNVFGIHSVGYRKVTPAEMIPTLENVILLGKWRKEDTRTKINQLYNADI